MIYQENTSEVSWNDTIFRLEEKVSFHTNNIVKILLIVNTLLCLLGFGLIGYFIQQEESIIILHYNVYFGVDIQGSWWQAYIFPMAGTLFFLFHILFAYHFYRRCERIASYLMLLGSVLLSLGIVIVSVGIAVINY